MAIVLQCKRAQQYRALMRILQEHMYKTLSMIFYTEFYYAPNDLSQTSQVLSPVFFSIFPLSI